MKPRSIRIADIGGSNPNISPLPGGVVPPASYYAFNGIFNAGSVPATQRFDVDYTVDFFVSPLLDPDSGGRNLVGNPTGNGVGNTNYIVGVYLYNYNSGGFETFKSQRFTINDNMLACFLCYYLANRYTPARMEYDRVYGSMQSTVGASTSQLNTKALMGTTISDGVTSRDFYATAVEKDLENNRVTVTWVEE